METAATFDFLRSIGCGQAQGYLIGKPLGEAGLTQFLDNAAAKPLAATASTQLGR